MEHRKRILICPLDWGLGHATRCIPIIEELLTMQHEVCIASAGDALSLLRIEFPELPYCQLTGYSPRYFTRSFLVSFALQFPKFIKTIRKEHQEINNIVTEQKIDIVISDNRYGCWSAKVPSIFISHQLTIQSPVFSGLINYFQRIAIKNFSALWVPDVVGEYSLAGNLSAHGNLTVTYIGHLSRFHPIAPIANTYEVLALISGPEPQRSIFEGLVVQQLKKSGKKAIMVRGMPDTVNKKMSGNLDEINHLAAKELNQVIASSEIVISRPGYSTIMDLARLGKRAVFVPTPGQTEQEYLGKRLMKNGIAFCMPQHGFDLNIALSEALHYDGFSSICSDDLLKKALNSLLT